MRLSAPEHGVPSRDLDLLSDGGEEADTEVNAEHATQLSRDTASLSSFMVTNSHCDLDVVPEHVEIPLNSIGISRVGETSQLLSLLHSATNNLPSHTQASSFLHVISQKTNRKLFTALIAESSPAMKSIARTVISTAIRYVDVALVGALLAAGLDPNLDMGGGLGNLFLAAIRTCSSGIVQAFLDHGASVNVASYGKQATPLEAAAQTGRLDLVQLLLRAGADLNVPGQDHGASVLAQAASHGGIDLVQLLVDAGADVYGPIRENPCRAYENKTALCHAAMRGDVAMARLLLSHGAAVHVLCYAVVSGNTNMLQLLLDHGANDLIPALSAAYSEKRNNALRFLVRSEFDRRGVLHNAFAMQSFYSAISCGDLELVRCLVESGIGVKITPSILTEALRFATQRGQLHIAQLLVDHGADIHMIASDEPSATVLQLAVSRRHVELVEFFLRLGADSNVAVGSKDRTILETAAYENDLVILQLLLEYAADMARQGRAALVAAVQYASPGVLQALLDAWALTGHASPTNLRCWLHKTPLEVAVNRTGAERIQLLLDYKVYKAGDNSLALRKAIRFGKLKAARLLLESGAHVGHLEQYEERADGWAVITALDEAAANGYVDMLHRLLGHQTTTDERTQALQAAAISGKLAAVRVLLDHGVDVNAGPMGRYEEQGPRTALQAAAGTGNLELVRCLLEAGADVESKVCSPKEEGTALQFAAIAGSVSVVTALIQEGADIKAPAMGRYGRTALEGAAEHGRLDTVQLLINMGAEMTGSRALVFARREGHDGVVALLLEHGFEDTVDESDSNWWR